ncbi:MAG: sugar phosphate isomerase/epimerase [Candidatus Hydrogenedentes bacterium]|nr:sugar phosphate isomerase/epimerase [Candidatus Hydrogenedentota bacterium]
MIRDAGFDATCLWWEERNEGIRRMRHRAPDLVREAGLRIDNLHVPYQGCAELWSPVDDTRVLAVERHVAWVRDCARHDIDCMVMHVAEGRGTPSPNAHGVDSLRRILEVAEKLGVTLAIENTRSPAHLDHLFENIHWIGLSLCFDTSHDWLYSPDPLALLHRWHDRLVCMHLCDTDGKRDRHWLPGEGVIDFAAIGKALSTTVIPSAMLEAIPTDRSADPVRFLDEAYARLNKLLHEFECTRETATRPSAREAM